MIIFLKIILVLFLSVLFYAGVFFLSELKKTIKSEIYKDGSKANKVFTFTMFSFLNIILAVSIYYTSILLLSKIIIE